MHVGHYCVKCAPALSRRSAFNLVPVGVLFFGWRARPRYHLLGLLSTFATSSLEHLFVEPIAQASSRPQCENSDFIDYIQLESSDRAVEDVVEVLSALALGASCCPGPKDVARLGVGRGALTALLSIYSCKVIDMQKLVPAHYSAVASSLWALVGCVHEACEL